MFDVLTGLNVLQAKRKGSRKNRFYAHKVDGED